MRKNGELLLLRIGKEKDGFSLAIVDQRHNGDAGKLAEIKSLVKLITAQPEVIGGIVLVRRIGSLMHQIQSEAIYTTEDGVIKLVDLAVRRLGTKLKRRFKIVAMKSAFHAFQSSDMVTSMKDYYGSTSLKAIPRKRHYSSKSLGESPEVYQRINEQVMNKEQKDFEGHQEWNME
jgi:hypothetical protein